MRTIRWAIPLVAVASAVALRLTLRGALAEDSPFLLFFAAVMVSAAYGGRGPGLMATALAAAAANFFLTPPFYRFSVNGRSEIVALLLFVTEGSVISIISGRLHQAVRESRRLERRVLEIADRERARIGRDLHDGLGQQLLGAALLAKSAESRLAANDSTTTLVDDVRHVQRVVGDALSWTRDLARQLSATTIANDGLLPALQDLADNAERLFSIRCVATAEPGLRSPSPLVCEHLYRIAQEAITNAVKHGRAWNVELAWRGNGDRQVLEIRDTGQGFQTSSEEPRDGIGLHVMRSRAELIGGDLSIGKGENLLGAVVRCEFRAEIPERS
jgi:signal transduction histidine kinase